MPLAPLCNISASPAGRTLQSLLQRQQIKFELQKNAVQASEWLRNKSFNSQSIFQFLGSAEWVSSQLVSLKKIPQFFSPAVPLQISKAEIEIFSHPQ